MSLIMVGCILVCCLAYTIPVERNDAELESWIDSIHEETFTGDRNGADTGFTN